MSNTPLIGQHLLSSATIPLVRLLTMDLLKPSSVAVHSSSSAAPLGRAAGSRKRGKPVGVAPHYLIERVVGRRANGSAAPRQARAISWAVVARSITYIRPSHVKPAGVCRYLLCAALQKRDVAKP